MLKAPFFASIYFFLWAFLVIFLLMKNVPAILFFAYECTNMSDKAVEEVLLDPDLKIEMAKALQFVYRMKHGGEEELQEVIKSLLGFQKSVITTLMSEEQLANILSKAPNCLELASYYLDIPDIPTVIERFDTDCDYRLDKGDVQAFRLELESVIKRYTELSLML